MPKKCHICEESFKFNALLVAHYFERHNARFCCQYCNFQFTSKNDKRNHVNKIHVRGGQFRCVMCGRTKSCKSSMKQHLNADHKDVRRRECKNCKIIMPDINSRITHEQYCLTGKDKTKSTSVHVCQYCSKEFPNRYDHCNHLISVHEAGVMCSYCDRQFVASCAEDRKRVIKEHVERDHETAQSWTCIYCNLSFGTRGKLEDHHRQHLCLQCGKCGPTLMPSVTAKILHKAFQHKIVEKKMSQSPSKDSPSLAALCLWCLQRCPMSEFYDHLRQHAIRDGALVSCNGCFGFVDIPDIYRHALCFEGEAVRFARKALEGEKSNLILCHCGFCANSYRQLNRHQDWCHNKVDCQDCGKSVTGTVGMEIHACSKSLRRIGPTANNLLSNQSPSFELTRFPLRLNPNSASTSFSRPQESTAGPSQLFGAARSTTAPRPSIAAESNEDNQLELPDYSPERDVKENDEIVGHRVEEEETDFNNRDEAALKSVKKEKTETNTSCEKENESTSDQGTNRKKRPSTPSSSTSSSSNDEEKGTISRKRPLRETTPIIEKSKRRRMDSDSSSDSPSDSGNEQEDEEHIDQRFCSKIAGKSATPSKESSGSSSPSSSDEEQETNTKRNTGFSLKDTGSKKQDISTTPAWRTNAYAAAAIDKNLEPTRTVVKKYFCKLCDSSSMYRANIKRHVATMHNVIYNRSSEHCETRLFSVDEGQRTADIGIGESDSSRCQGCEKWKKKAERLEKFMEKMIKYLDQAKTALEDGE